MCTGMSCYSKTRQTDTHTDADGLFKTTFLHVSMVVHPKTRSYLKFDFLHEILKTVEDTVIKRSSENNEEPHKPHTDTIIRSLKK